jgi:hypothetical protein
MTVAMVQRNVATIVEMKGHFDQRPGGKLVHDNKP